MRANPLIPLFLLGSIVAACADPEITSWQTGISSKYARIYSSTANRTAGTSETTWTNGTQTQSSPAYAGVNEIDVSTDYVYILSTGLGGQIMGPWNSPNVPKNQQDLWRFPRTPSVPTANRSSASSLPTTATNLGAMGFMVDGVAAYNTSDGFSYSHASSEDASPMAGIGNGDGVWNRDAFVTEYSSFDNSLAHSQSGGEYHYHVNPIATRYLVGDNVLYNATTKSYSENTATTTFTHSPILGWMKDGLPLYGPYGYDGGGTGAAATASVSGGAVASVTVTSAGTYTFAPSVSFGSGGASATATMSVVSAVVSTSWNSGAGGTGYKVGDVLTVSGGTATTSATLTVASISGTGSGPIATVRITQAGAYTVVPPDYVSVTGGSGSGAELTLLWGVSAVSVTSGGSGYASAPAVAIGGVRRMVSGYQLRDGTNGTTDLNTTGRESLPAWAQAVQGRTTLSSSLYGPNVGSTYTLGHYAEDYDYLGDLGYTQGSRANSGGVFFDLDVYNSRFCVTPDYPNGTWAYFTTITSTGTSFYPYSVGRWYRGNPNTGGGSTTSAARSSDGAVNQFLGGANTALAIGTPDVTTGTVTLIWSSVEGGTYSVANSPNNSTFTTEASGLSPTNVPSAPTTGNESVTTTSSYGTSGLSGTQYAKVTRTALAAYDSAGQTASTVSQSATTPYSAATNVATLSSLTLSSGTLTPTFASGTTSYTATVANAASITVTPTATQAGAGITVNGTAVLSGSASSPITLGVGSNTITTVVTSEDGTANQTYTVTVSSNESPSLTSGTPAATATLGDAYSFSFTANGYPAPTFSLTSGSLPPGLTLSSGGTLSGTPTESGTYTATVTAGNGVVPGASQTFTIAVPTLPASVTFGNLTYTYTGSAHAATATTDPLGLDVVYTYNGSLLAPTNAGNYTVTGTIDATNYTGSATGTLTIDPATPAITLAGLSAVYNGKAHAVTATTVPRSLPVGITYNGSSVAPTAAGQYSVVATVGTTNYAGTADGTLVISPVAAVAATSAATSITAASATLNAKVDPEGSDTTVTFQYGTSAPAYGFTTTSQDIGPGPASLAVNAPVNGLSAGTTYHFRVVAQSAGGTVDGADKTFTTLAEPVFANSPATPLLSASGAQVSFGVDPNGVATTVYFKYSTDPDFGAYSETAAQSIGSGKATVNVTAFLSGLQPDQLYYYEVVTTSAAGTFTSAEESFTTLGFDTTEVAKTTGSAPGTSYTYTSFGHPAVDASDGAAFSAKISSTSTANNAGIWANQGSDSLSLIARTGSAAPGAGGAVFATLNDPVYNNNEDVAFSGTLKIATGLVTTATENGVWASNEGTLALLAREGGTAPGAGSATFATFGTLGLSDSGGALFSATLATSSAAGVTTGNNAGIWEGATAADLTLMLRTGEETDTDKTLASFKFLPTETCVNGQTRGFDPVTGHLVANATYSGTEGTGIVRVATPGSPVAVATGNDPAAGTSGAVFATFSSPAISESASDAGKDCVAFAATLTIGIGDAVKANAGGIWADDSSGTRQLIARLGQVAPGTGTHATFTAFSDPVYNVDQAVAFRATLSTGMGLAGATTDSGIWSTGAGSLALVAQEGGQAPGCATGVKFSSFTELALDDVNGGGVMFLATLTGTGVTTVNNTGIFAIDNDGVLQLIVRTGDTLGGKTVTALSFLPAETVVNGQTRSFSPSTGDLVYNATFSDKSSAIFNVVFP